MKRTYFATLRTTSGIWKTYVWDSEHKKGTWANAQDLLFGIRIKKSVAIDMPYYTERVMRSGRKFNVVTIPEHVYLMSKKNIENECVGNYEIVDLR